MDNLSQRRVRFSAHKAAMELYNKIDALDKTDPDWQKKVSECLDHAFSLESSEDDRGGWDFQRERGLDCLTADDILLIRPVRDTDNAFYNNVRMQWVASRKIDGKEIMKTPHYWHETQRERSFFCICERLQDRTPMGYISIKDTRKPLWEIAIEFDRQYCHHGYGSRSILLFLQEIQRITGIEEFQARVEPDNVPSQKCMEHIGASLVGICNGDILVTEEMKEAFENESLEMIDDHMQQLAGRLLIPPRKLLSHVLDYRIFPGFPSSAAQRCGTTS